MPSIISCGVTACVHETIAVSRRKGWESEFALKLQAIAGDSWILKFIYPDKASE